GAGSFMPRRCEDEVARAACHRPARGRRGGRGARGRRDPAGVTGVAGGPQRASGRRWGGSRRGGRDLYGCAGGAAARAGAGGGRARDGGGGVVGGGNGGRGVAGVGGLDAIARHAVIVSPDYPLPARRGGWDGWRAITMPFKLRPAAFDTIADILLLLDYLDS